MSRRRADAAEFQTRVGDIVRRIMAHTWSPRVRQRIGWVLAMMFSTSLGSVLNAQTTFEVVHTFDQGTDGRRPEAPLIQAADGSFYGTTAFGGVYGNGSIYRIAPDGTEAVLHSFKVDVDGSAPSALIESTDGLLYGTAVQPLTGLYGVIFRLAADGTFTIGHRFACGADGATPSGALLQADDGTFYGTTIGRFDDQCGARSTVFRMTADGTVTTIHVFSGTDGTEPNAPLIQAHDGNLYGTARSGGPFGGGTVFRVTTDGTLSVLHGFHYPDDQEGQTPQAGLVENADGMFYGTTASGGQCTLCGTVFRLSPGGAFQVLYAFEPDSDTGRWPVASLVADAAGNLYGTTALTRGAVFQITPDGDVTVLHAFTGGWDGRGPTAALVLAADGAFYGTASVGGPSSTGTVFQLTADGTFDVVYTFPGSLEGASPSVLIQGADGGFYGITSQGGTFNVGAVFQLTPDGSLTVLHTFTGGADGAHPTAFLQADDGMFYGITGAGGPAGVGTLFQIAADGQFMVLHAFTGDPSVPVGAPRGLLQAVDGNIYGVVTHDGAGDRGAVFRVTRDGTYTVLYSFTGGADGRQPITLLQATDGNFYGTTYYGGIYGAGSVFRLTPDGELTTLYDDFPHRVSLARSSILQATDGNLYFVKDDNVVRLRLDGEVTVVHTFMPLEGSQLVGVVQAVDGNLYGTTRSNGPPPARGTVFRMTLDGDVTVLHGFSYEEGWEPLEAPIQASDGTLYGTTAFGGGTGKQGVVYRLGAPTRRAR
jgi:uncharacterized repeat protein (TIGR03803 family)